MITNQHGDEISEWTVVGHDSEGVRIEAGQHCTAGDDCGITFSHTAGWCGTPQTTLCMCPFDGAEASIRLHRAVTDPDEIITLLEKITEEVRYDSVRTSPGEWGKGYDNASSSLADQIEQVISKIKGEYDPSTS